MTDIRIDYNLHLGIVRKIDNILSPYDNIRYYLEERWNLFTLVIQFPKGRKNEWRKLKRELASKIKSIEDESLIENYRIRPFIQGHPSNTIRPLIYEMMHTYGDNILEKGISGMFTKCHEKYSSQ